MGFLVIGITLILLVGLIVASCFTYKTEVVRSTGIFTTVNKSNIMSQTGGKVKILHKQNGDYVNEGDLIIELETVQVDAQILSLEYKVVYLLNHIGKIDTFIAALNSFDYSNIDNNTNPFTDGEFYLQYESFLKSIKKIEITKTEKDGTVINKTEDELKDERMLMISQYQSQYYSQKGQYEYEYLGIKGQKEAYELTLETYKIYASKSGYINYSINLTSDTVIGNDSLGTISEKLTDDNVVIEAYVDASSRSHIKVGHNVDVAVVGLSQSEYGVISGSIISISSDSTINDDKVYYKVNVKPNNINLSNGKNTVEIQTGQFGEIRIKYEERTWIKWILKIIGIFN